VAGLGLRSAILVVGPLAPQIAADLSLSHALTGLLSTLPLVLMGVSAIFAAQIAVGWGYRLTLGVSLLVAGLASVLRAFAPEIASMLLVTVPIGVGMGIASVVLPMFVKARFVDQPARATGAYILGIVAGSSFTISLAIPASNALGGWRQALLLFGLGVVACALAWFALVRGHETRSRVPLRLPHLPWRSSRAWFLVLLFWFQSVLFYGLIAWLVPSLVERGWEPSAAGAVTGALAFLGLPGTLLVSLVGDRLPRGRTFAFASAGCLVGFVGLATDADLAWLWAACVGLSLAPVFSLVMTLPLDAAERPSQVGQFTALMLGAGYILSAASPAVLGALRDATGSFASSLWSLAAVAAVMLATSPLVGRLSHRHAIAYDRAPA
jgi:CP family cyanate transporter-like MFS transporter